MDELIRKANVLVEALPYIRAFAGKTVVLKYGGKAMTDSALKEGFATDVVLMKYVGLNPVVVHGGGPQIDQMLKRLAIEPKFRQGVRVTDEAPMGVGKDGRTYNINADLVAGAVAAALGAEKLVVLTDVRGIKDEDGKLVSTLARKDVARMVKKGTISEGMLPKVQACLTALEGGVRKTHVIDGRMPHAILLEIFTDKGIGTEIVA